MEKNKRSVDKEQEKFTKQEQQEFLELLARMTPKQREALKKVLKYSKIIKEDSVWVCDPESIYYNTLQSKNNPQKDWADKGGAENMYVKFSKGSSNACICFGFNGDGESAYSATPYAGSALFIDGVGENGNMNSGYGDIKISGKDMTKLLSYLCANDNPVITIKSAQ